MSHHGTIPRLLHRSHVTNNLIAPLKKVICEEAGETEKKLTVLICLVFSGAPTIVLKHCARLR